MSEFQMEKNYDPSKIEGRTYERWEKSGAFTAHRVEGKKPFTIVMPPPNVTGQLHMGHAMDCVLQDSLIRFHRMKGDPTLWLPGTDHASIATEVKVVKQLREEGLSKEALGREGFLERAWAWKKEYGGRITRQLRRLGASCDWTRERFTMDEGCSKAVREVFVRLYEKDLIYRGYRLVNWCTDCMTAISDAEVEYEEKDGNFWHILYPVKETGEMLELATTRPETMLGDTAVAINPADPRYTHLHGCHVILPLINKEIPIVCDEHADMEKGTGVVKITPAHDPNDYEVGQRHQLPIVRVFTYDGHMTGAQDKAEADEILKSGKASVNEPEVLDCGKYAGMTTLEARKAIVSDLEALGLLKAVEPIRHEVGTCYRCHHVIEPMMSLQWFVRMEPLAKPAIAAVKNGETRFVPDRFAKIYNNWMENMKDWCISRQLWWGHRIPAWYCPDCGKMIVSREDPTECSCGCKSLKQDEDVLDTWFSSALWPFSTLGWPEKTEDLAYFYPTNTLVTGYDIIFFWVARMIFSGIEQMGHVPFDTVVIHGLVRDAQGRKMSKSAGNGIDPLEIIDAYGADALRFSLVLGISPGNDTRYSTEKVEMARNFANKIWNASRFVLMNVQGETPRLDPDALQLEDKWILTRYQEAVRQVTENFDNADYGLAAQKIYDFAWSEFCDWYIELSKSGLMGDDPARKANVQAVLLTVLQGLLKLLHPFMPFVTEELYSLLPGKGEESCMLSAWPQADDALVFTDEAARMEGVMEMIRSIRNLRSSLNVQPGHRARLMVRPQKGWAEVLMAQEGAFRRLAGVSSETLLASNEKPEGKIVSAVVSSGEFFIPLGELVDLDAERKRLGKEKERIEGEIKRAEGKLQNPGFISKAPAALVESEKKKLETNRQMLSTLAKRLEELAD